MFPFINVFGYSVPVYGLLMLAGFASAWCLIAALTHIKHSPAKGDAGLAFLMCVCGGLVGSYAVRPVMKIAEIAVRWEDFSKIPAGELLSYIFGEVVFFGGFLGGAAALIIFCRCYKIDVTSTADLFAPALALGHAVGRVGCLAGGCCFGVTVSRSCPLAVVYPASSQSAPAGVALLAVPAIESAFLVLLAALLVIVYVKSKTPGQCSTLYLTLYPAARFVIEFYRGDVIRGKYGAFTTSQYIALPVFALGLALMVNRYRRRKQALHGL